MLRKILYVDTEALDNYISVIEGFTFEEQEVKQYTTNNKGGKGKISLGKTGVEGNIGQNKEETISMNARITDASKLDKIIKYLNSNDSLKYYEYIDNEIWNDIKRNDFLEVFVTPRFSKLEEVTSAANSFKQLYNSFKPFLGENFLDRETTEALDGFEMLSESRDGNSLSCVFNLEDNKFPMIGNIDKTYLKVPKDKLTTQVYMLCKVQKKIEEGKSVCLDEIFEDVNTLSLNRGQKRKNQNRSISNPKEIKDEIKGPAFMVIPIAIYQ